MRDHFLSIIGGLVVGMIVNMLVMVASVAVYPLPEGLDVHDSEALARHIATLPVSAMWLALAGHVGGSFVAGAVCSLISRRKAYDRGLVIGTIMLVAGIWNLTQIPPPVWLALLEVALYIPAALLGAYVGGALVKKRSEAAPSQP